jgi:hypothetical protein
MHNVTRSHRTRKKRCIVSVRTVCTLTLLYSAVLSATVEAALHQQPFTVPLSGTPKAVVQLGRTAWSQKYDCITVV